jgi:hypothetical protein
MRTSTFVSIVLAGAAFVGGASSVHAGQGQPGSLLVFPTFDNTRGGLTLITVTNTDADQTTGAINVEFVYINGVNCQEFNRTRTLTPNDEISVLTQFDNPNQHKGYVYVFAKSKTTGAAVKFDHLIGTELVIEGSPAGQGTNTDADYSLNAWSFKAGSALAEGANTDLNSNGLRDLNNNEYEAAPALLDVPRFIGEGGPLDASSELVLINLTGGAAFTAVVDLLVYNDNEEVFSAQYTFTCWARVALTDVSAVFDNDFLLSTNQASGEVAGPPPGTFNEIGWYRINGDTAFSTAAQFPDPAILSAHIETIHIDFGGAFLPFTEGTQTNGSLLSHNLFGT